MRRVEQALQRAARRANPGAPLPTVAYRRSERALDGFPSEVPPLDTYPDEAAPEANAVEAAREAPASPARRANPVIAVNALEEGRAVPRPQFVPRVAAKPLRVAIENVAGGPQATPPLAVADERVDIPSEYNGRLITTEDASAELVTQFDRLAEALIRSQAVRNVRTVMISSAQPQEGRSLTAANLALALSQRYGKRVLLIDADPARPSLHRFFNLPNESGLFEALRNGRSYAEPLTVTSRLSIVPAGSTDASEAELLASAEMKGLLQQAASTYDWVVLDTAAASTLADAHLLAWLVDGVLLVIKAAETSAAAVQRAVADLGGHRVLGLVLNQVDARASGRIPQAQSLRG